MSDLVAEPLDVLAYHERTKHAPGAYAKGPGTIDWDNQPDPFRRFDGCELIQLPLLADEISLPFAALNSPEAPSAQPVTLDNLSILLQTSLALSAWKNHGAARWSVRCNPSSGNLHPTETYLVLVGVPDFANGLYHYRADEHALECRCRFDESLSSQEPQVWLGFSSVHWREAWKYGERAFRYCQLDSGHALASISYASGVLGWQALTDDQLSDEQLAQLLGINRQQDFEGAESETPDLIIRLTPATGLDLQSILQAALAGEWTGSANVLDRRHFYDWPIIDDVSAVCQQPASYADESVQPDVWPEPLPGVCQEPATALLRRRRSAQGFDGQTVMPQADFVRLLDHLLPRPDCIPWSGLASEKGPAPAHCHLIFFVHRVEGLAPGLYALTRTSQGSAMLAGMMRPEFRWESVAGIPEHLNFSLLLPAKAERTAANLSCQQPIAGTSAFSLAMVAEFEPQVSQQPWRYRQLYREAGAIGQVLYLEAEACGLRGTGIGCFYDDNVHQLLGLSDQRLQSLYHFTVGEPLNDPRIISLPPYATRR